MGRGRDSDAWSTHPRCATVAARRSNKRTIAQCQKAFDMMCERALSRESHGNIIGEHQMVQEKIADSYAELNMLRLLVLWTAWKIDNSSTQETRTEIAAVKFTMAKVLRD